MADNPPNIYENFVPNPETQEFMDEEISRAPQSQNDFRHDMESTNNSPETSGGDVDADWSEAENDGAESFGGHNPTPDQSDVEANAQAMGFTFQDNQEIDLLDKMQRRDQDRFELEEDSKDGDTI